jgi:hypothetical protein
MRISLSILRTLGRERETRRPRSSRIGVAVGANQIITNITATARIENRIINPMVDVIVDAIVDAIIRDLVAARAVVNASTDLSLSSMIHISLDVMGESLNSNPNLVDG